MADTTNASLSHPRVNRSPASEIRNLTTWPSCFIEWRSFGTNTVFNSVLLNLYRDGADSVAWHADDESKFGLNPLSGQSALEQLESFNSKGEMVLQEPPC
jgi:alkylated DNA repair dioxygenase AlkB